MEHSWQGRLGSSILGGAFGAFFGWALSFTQGPSPQRWPWIVGGGLIVAGIALVVWDRALAPRFKADSGTRRERKIRRVFGKVLGKGQAVLQNMNPGNLLTVDPVLKWESWAEKTIGRSAGDDFAGLFAVAETTMDPLPTEPQQMRGWPDGSKAIGLRVDAKLRWLRYQIKSGPHT